MASWIVRGGSRIADKEKDFLDTDSVGIYFGVDQPIDEMGGEALLREIERYYVQDCRARGITFSPRIVTFFRNQTLAFRDGIQLGDTVIMPRKASRGHTVARGVVRSGCEYWAGKEYPHRRRVQWLDREMPREKTGLTWYPSDQRTVFRIDAPL